MSILYTKTYETGSGTQLTDLVSSAGKDWDASYWIENGIYCTGRPPCFVNFRGDVYVIGAFSRVLYRPKQDRRFLPAGIIGARRKLSVIEAAGSGGSEGRALAFVTLLHKEGALELAESDRSNVVDVGSVTGGGFTWSNLPTENEEFRVTHIRGYRSMDGDEYRMAWESPYGIASFTENLLTNARTILAPDWKDNGIPPKGLHYGTDWAGRVFYARTAEHPYRLWWSAPGAPQNVKDTAYVDTWDRSTITAIHKARNELIVFTQRNAYLVRQFGQESLEDFVLSKLDSNVGCISHFGAVEIHNRLWFPSEDGIWIYDGAFHYVMRDMRPYWVDDYTANKNIFQAGHAYDDRNDKTYVFVAGRNPPQLLEGEFLCGTVAYVGTYEMFEPSIGGDRPQPDWTIDAYGRRNSSAVYDADGNVLIGSCDGIIRKADPTDGDDDGDSLLKAMVIRHGLNLLNEPGDDLESGKQLDEFWCYVESELNGWTLYLMGGDEHAWRQTRPDNVWQFWKVDVPASQKIYASTIANVTKTLQATPKTVHYFGKPVKVSGRGYLTEIRATSPVGLKYRGHGGSFSPGSAERTFEFETNFDLTLEWRIFGDTPWNTGPVRVIDTTDPSPTNIAIEFRSSVVYNYGAIAYPVGLTFDFAGSNMPGDSTDSIVTPNTEKITTVVFLNAATVMADGTLSVTATDANGVSDSVAIDVLVATHTAKLQNQVDAGGWTDVFPVGPVTFLNTVQIRSVIGGSLYPVFLTEQHTYEGYSPNSPDLQINAAGNYEEWTLSDPFPVVTHYALLATKDAVDGNFLASRNGSILWT